MLHEEWYLDYKQKVWACRACTAREECNRPVPGIGDLNSSFMVIGRNPGRNEDALGSPFVGPAGYVLDRFLSLCGVSREKGCFLTNMCLCHTKGDRFLSKEEVKTCVKKHLVSTLVELKPKVVMVCGTQPNYFLNGLSKPAHHHGSVYNHRMGYSSICSLHPAVVCYNPDLWVRFETLVPVVRRLLNDYSLTVGN
jgi:uracil-DNA glycosylase family 4